MAILLSIAPRFLEEWLNPLQQAGLGEIRVWPEVGNAAEIDYALVALPPAGSLAGLPNLKGVQSLYAGVETVLHPSSGLPPDAPVFHMIEPGITQGMCEYVLGWVLHYHLHTHRFLRAQREKRWLSDRAGPPPAHMRTVGVLGLGALGGAVARLLAAQRFVTYGWSRTEKHIEGVTCHYGPQGLEKILSDAEILVCLLPQTAETTGLLNAARLALMPDGACLINVARGPLLVDDDLLNALDARGGIEAATLDVFDKEPLRDGHPFWTHPKISITPHIASLTRQETAIEVVKRNLALLRGGAAAESLVGFVQRPRGY